MRVENWKRAIMVFIRCYFLGAVLSNASTFSHKGKAIVTKILCQNKVQNFFLLNQDSSRKDGEKVTEMHKEGIKDDCKVSSGCWGGKHSSPNTRSILFALK